MKKIILVAAALFLFGCGSTTHLTWDDPKVTLAQTPSGYELVRSGP